MTDFATYVLALSTGPMLRGDAIVVLCGEDGQARADVGLQLFAQRGGETLVLSGGRHEPPLILGADHLREGLIAKGVAPDRIVLEDTSMNTHQQAEAVVALAAERQWGRILLVASAYHLPRALLTFIAALGPEQADAIHVLPVQSLGAWFAAPPGGDRTRLEIWHVEQTKITEYQALGHAASYDEGMAYLKHWEGR